MNATTTWLEYTIAHSGGPEVRLSLDYVYAEVLLIKALYCRELGTAADFDVVGDEEAFDIDSYGRAEFDRALFVPMIQALSLDRPVPDSLWMDLQQVDTTTGVALAAAVRDPPGREAHGGKGHAGGQAGGREEDREPVKRVCVSHGRGRVPGGLQGPAVIAEARRRRRLDADRRPRRQSEERPRPRALLSHSHPGATWAEILAHLANDHAKRADPVQRAERRADRMPRSFTATEDYSPSVDGPRPLPRAVRDSVLAKAGSACEFADPLTGARCGRRTRVEVDHVLPRTLGGTNEAST